VAVVVVTVDLSNYVDVAERIRLFFDAWPNGSIQATTPTTVDIGDKVFLEVTARVYRTPLDERPSVATAWEPFPGTTSFTRNSEAMNCETSAAGRALAFLGFGGRRVASADEVQTRQGPDPVDTFKRLSTLQPETQAALRKLATETGHRLTIKEMANDAGWHDMVLYEINQCE
jgi:hypothetical protein